MPIVSSEAKKILDSAKFEFANITDADLVKLIAAVAYQDAGNYDGKFVGQMASFELMQRAARKVQIQTTILAVIAIVISVITMLLGFR